MRRAVGATLLGPVRVWRSAVGVGTYTRLHTRTLVGGRAHGGRRARALTRAAAHQAVPGSGTLIRDRPIERPAVMLIEGLLADVALATQTRALPTSV